MLELSLKILNKIKKLKYDFFITLPCKFTSELIKLLENDDSIIHVPVTREEEGVGIAAGAYLAGKRPCLVFQNSGIGNSINAIESLLRFYGIPVLFLLSHRGTESEKIKAQKPMGKAVPIILDNLRIPVIILEKEDEISKIDNLKDNTTNVVLISMEFWK